MIPEINDISDCDSANDERFAVRRLEPLSKLSHIMNDQPPSSGSEVMTTKKLVKKTGFIFPNWDTVKNIYARILHRLSPAIGHEFDTSSAQPGCKWHFTTLIYLRILTLHFQKHGSDHFARIQILYSVGK